jgi:hypothetical protein
MSPEYLDRPPAGWVTLDVMKAGSGRKWDWVALVIPDELDRTTACWVRIPGKHRNQDAAWDALEALAATRH